MKKQSPRQMANAAEQAAYFETIARERAKCKAFASLTSRFTRIVSRYLARVRLASGT